MKSAQVSRKWADEPVKIITTPQSGRQQPDLFTTGAIQMSLLHNSMIRGFNSIYQQAPYVKDADKAHFIGYALTWYRFIKSHHDDEEECMFPIVENILTDERVWDDAHDEHKAILTGLGEYNSYLSSLSNPSAFDPTKLIRIMDSFRHHFENHFHHEITTIAGFASHPNAPTVGSTVEDNAAAKLKAWGQKTVGKGGITDVVPFFLLNLDRTAEGGKWAWWPSMPAPIKWGILNIVGAWHGAWWKFASCDAHGVPRELYALRD